MDNIYTDVRRMKLYGMSKAAFPELILKITFNPIESVQGFMKDIMTWADQQDYIKAIFWFCASRTANINENLSLSALLDRNGRRTDLSYKMCYD